MDCRLAGRLIVKISNRVAIALHFNPFKERTNCLIGTTVYNMVLLYYVANNLLD